MKFVGLIVAGLFFSLAASSVRGSGHTEGVLLLHAARQEVNVDAPWNRQPVTREQHLATCIGPNLYLTTAYAVKGVRSLELQRFGQVRKVNAEVIFKDPEANLALIQASKSQLIGSVPIIPLGESLNLDDRVIALRNLDNYKLELRPIALRRVQILSGATSPYALPFYLFEVTDTSGYGWSEPVIKDGKLVAIATGHQNTSLWALPIEVIKHFLADQHNGHYKGFPFIGISSMPLKTPEQRRFFNATQIEGGVRVVEVNINSSFYGSLEVDDVIYEIEGRPLDEQGFVQHASWGRIYLNYEITKKYAGDDLTLSILRKGKKMKLTRKLIRFDRNRSLIPHSRDTQVEPYLIFGGLIFQEISRPYLETWGSNWHTKAPDRLLFYWRFRNEPKKEPSERLIVLNRILSDKFNQGYKDFSDLHLVKANGMTVNSLRNLSEILKNPVRKNGKMFAVFDFAVSSGQIVLDYEGLQAAQSRIAKTYGINETGNFFSSMQ